MGHLHHLRRSCPHTCPLIFPPCTLTFLALPFVQLAVGADGRGQQTAAVLCHVMRALARDLSWRPHLPELLQGLDEVRLVGGGS